MKDYFQGAVIDDEQLERCYWRRIGFVFFAALAMALILAPLMGCSTPEDAKVCYVKVMGATGDGLAVVVQHCMTPEAFEASQK